METNHTPGPWSVVDGYYPCFREVLGASFKISAVMSASDLTEDDYVRRSADLKLIAAAPLLLEALQDAEKRMRSHLILLKCDDEFIAGETAMACAAIAAATN